MVSGISPDRAAGVEELDERQREQTTDDRELALREIDDAGSPQGDVNPQGHERVTAADG